MTNGFNPILQVSRDASFRHVHPDWVSARGVAQHEVMLPRAFYDLLIEFTSARAVAEVLSEWDAELSSAELASVIARWLEAGLLELAEGVRREASPDAGSEAVRERGGQLDLRDYLAPKVVAPEALERIGAALRAGNACVIRDAFDPDFAEEQHAGLEAIESWQVHEDFQQSYFAYRHHNVYDTHRFSPALRRCQDVFSSVRTKRFVTDLAQRDGSGPTAFSASLYLPGDYSLPHNDRDSRRSVAFIWHLTRNWETHWGGHLFWCDPSNFIAPRFNTLVLFAVSADSTHFVCPVSPYARGKRLTINGWWTRSEPVQAEAGGPGTARPGTLDGTTSPGRQVTEIGAGIYALGSHS